MKWNTFLEVCETGDILLFNSRGWLSWLIEWGQTSKYSHVGIIVKDPVFLNPDWKGVYLLQSGYENTPDKQSNTRLLGVQLTPIESIKNDMINNGNLY